MLQGYKGRGLVAGESWRHADGTWERSARAAAGYAAMQHRRGRHIGAMALAAARARDARAPAGQTLPSVFVVMYVLSLIHI